ncbi:hypothetical protein [Sphingobium sp. S6]|uniref:hypothetical protein n=1 Tax=Sphingobium sp. S6 TaxID=2758386 RepID=UPI003FA7C32E
MRFDAGGLREVAEHLFTWAGDLEILGPDALRKTIQERISLAAQMACTTYDTI